jgi:hypothetical protein
MNKFGRKKNNQQFDMGTQIQWKNASYDAPFDANKTTKYYTFIQIDGVERVIKYNGRFRSEARIYFEEYSRLHGDKNYNGKFYVLK